MATLDPAELWVPWTLINGLTDQAGAGNGESWDQQRPCGQRSRVRLVSGAPPCDLVRFHRQDACGG
jgi:hypothetical protein